MQLCKTDKATVRYVWSQYLSLLSTEDNNFCLTRAHIYITLLAKSARHCFVISRIKSEILSFSRLTDQILVSVYIRMYPFPRK